MEYRGPIGEITLWLLMLLLGGFILLFVVMVISMIAGMFRRPLSPEELAESKRKFEEELLSPEIAAVERLLGGKLPLSVVELYQDNESLRDGDYEVIDPLGNGQESWFVASLTPCTVQSQTYTFLPKDTGSFFEFANDGCGDGYYVELTRETKDDAPVYFLDHEGGEVFDTPVAPSVREFFSWQRRRSE